MSVKTRSQSIKHIREYLRTIQSTMIFELSIDKKTFVFDADLFDLSFDNVGILTEQIARTPAYIAYVGASIAHAERYLDRLQTAFDMYLVERIEEFHDTKAERARENRARAKYKKQVQIHENEIREAAYIVRVLKSYRDALDARYNLSQTLSANLRLEKQSYTN